MNNVTKATEEQTAKSEFITQSVENAKRQAIEMTHSPKEESITAEEIFKGILTIKEQVHQISIATAVYGKNQFIFDRL
ncbi:hypothetical protein G6554_19725 [Bacillus sp. MM2020_4]|nr:hypothetical protein [Bacillus sp. MM2020_4]